MKAVLKVMLQMFLFACLLTLAGTMSAQDSSAPAADNTKVNQRDKTRPSPPQINRKKTSRIGRSHERSVSLLCKTNHCLRTPITSRSSPKTEL